MEDQSLVRQREYGGSFSIVPSPVRKLMGDIRFRQRHICGRGKDEFEPLSGRHHRLDSGVEIELCIQWSQFPRSHIQAERHFVSLDLATNFTPETRRRQLEYGSFIL